MSGQNPGGVGTNMLGFSIVVRTVVSQLDSLKIKKN